MLKPNGVIIWDDYSPSKFQVKAVVDDIISEYDYEVVLVPIRGHLFPDPKRKIEKKSGEVIMYLK